MGNYWYIPHRVYTPHALFPLDDPTSTYSAFLKVWLDRTWFGGGWRCNAWFKYPNAVHGQQQASCVCPTGLNTLGRGRVRGVVTPPETPALQDTALFCSCLVAKLFSLKNWEELCQWVMFNISDQLNFGVWIRNPLVLLPSCSVEGRSAFKQQYKNQSKRLTLP